MRFQNRNFPQYRTKRNTTQAEDKNRNSESEFLSFQETTLREHDWNNWVQLNSSRIENGRNFQSKLAERPKHGYLHWLICRCVLLGNEVKAAIVVCVLKRNFLLIDVLLIIIVYLKTFADFGEGPRRVFLRLEDSRLRASSFCVSSSNIYWHRCASGKFSN